MENIIVVLVITAVFVFGYYVMRAVDRFLLENERRMTKEMEKKKPLVVRLSGHMTLEEIDKEIDKFRKDHINFEIILIEKSGMM